MCKYSNIARFLPNKVLEMFPSFSLSQYITNLPLGGEIQNQLNKTGLGFHTIAKLLYWLPGRTGDIVRQKLNSTGAYQIKCNISFCTLGLFFKGQSHMYSQINKNTKPPEADQVPVHASEYIYIYIYILSITG